MTTHEGFAMNILVTGSAGFVGSHPVAALISGGHAVMVLTYLMIGNLTKIAPVALEDAFTEGGLLDENLV